MAIIVKRNEQKLEKITVKELSYTLKFTGTGYDREANTFEIINDNLPNCSAHVKVLHPEEMLAVYEYMKKIVEGA